MKIKVLHIVESLHKGAVENWLVRMLEFSATNNEKLDWSFFCIESFEGRLELKVSENSSRIIHSKYQWTKPFKLMFEIRREVKKEKYYVVHCHHDLMSALYLLALVGVKCQKIVHVHNMDEHIPTKSALKTRILRFVFKRICWLLSTKIVGISNHTLDKFISYKKRNSSKQLIHYYGIQHLPFINAEYNRIGFLQKFNIPKDKKVILFCARIDPIKNPIRALEIFKKLIELNNNYFLLMVGKGGLEKEVSTFIRSNNLQEKSKFIGWSDDIPFILKNSDLLLYPHLEYPMEGLGIIIVEAQLAGLPILASLGVSKDPFFTENHLRLSLKESDDVWCASLNKMLSIEKNNEENILEYYTKSPFYMKTAFENLQNLY